MISEGDSYEEVLNNVKSAINFHIQTFGKEALDEDLSVLEVFVAETGVVV
ncbi:hypothetical protein RYO59_001159 [Thermosynechococcaceae cyanobacterium Okahandja]